MAYKIDRGKVRTLRDSPPWGSEKLNMCLARVRVLGSCVAPNVGGAAGNKQGTHSDPLGGRADATVCAHQLHVTKTKRHEFRTMDRYRHKPTR